ncbi:hypothetical protein FAUST_6142 [Fusarium austroamericanum]|uniref:Transcription activator GCR1-like domain-containing protein n=1 Tax=Fusarium austroamericanum TaxID=282268 RepID=A0AAN6BZT4_FUSAU|nr:hypothetical protein FAUST_6142 [Fusarium austroamericanum]
MSSSSELSDIDSPTMLLSPNLSPTRSVSRSVSEGPLRRSASEPCFGPITPATSQQSVEPAEQKAGDCREESIDDAIDQVPFSLARMVVNMRVYYASELEAERQRTDELTRQNEEMMAKMAEMDKRLQMHVVLMDGFVGFMREVKQGQFAVAELEIAKQFGGVHLDEIKGPVSDTCEPVEQSVEQLILSEDIPDPSDEQRTVRFTEEPTPFDSAIFDQSPPTPDVETPPVRSTGRRAPKRKNPPMRPHREVKRQTRADVRSVRLRHTSWRAINNGYDEESRDEHRGDTNDRDYDPEPEVQDENEREEEEHQEQEPEGTSPSPPPSEEDDADAEKPRYTVSRSTAPRFTSGPSGPRFKYHRMPKTVALVWQEWKHGSNGNPAIEELENKYNTSWRMGTLQERKYANVPHIADVDSKDELSLLPLMAHKEMSMEKLSGSTTMPGPFPSMIVSANHPAQDIEQVAESVYIVALQSIATLLKEWMSALWWIYLSEEWRFTVYLQATKAPLAQSVTARERDTSQSPTLCVGLLRLDRGGGQRRPHGPGWAGRSGGGL